MAMAVHQILTVLQRIIRDVTELIQKYFSLKVPHLIAVIVLRQITAHI